MKKFLEYVIEWKTYVCLEFTGFTMIMAAIFMACGSFTISIGVLAQVLVLAMICSFLQLIAFTDFCIKKMAAPLRLTIFAIPFLLIMAGFAIGFQWFPTEAIGAWLLFFLIFVLCFIGITIGFEIYYRISGRKYDGLLGDYQKKQKQ